MYTIAEELLNHKRTIISYYNSYKTCNIAACPPLALRRRKPAIPTRFVLRSTRAAQPELVFSACAHPPQWSSSGLPLCQSNCDYSRRTGCFSAQDALARAVQMKTFEDSAI